MAINYTDPQTVQKLRQKAIQDGLDIKQFDSWITQKVDQENALKGVESGALELTQISDPSLRYAIASQANLQQNPGRDLTEYQRKFSLGRDAAEKALGLLESKSATTGPVDTTIQKLQELTGGTRGTDFRANLALANTALKSAFLGTGQSSKEIEGLIDAVSNPYQQEDVLKTKLTQLIELINNQVPQTSKKKTVNAEVSDNNSPVKTPIDSNNNDYVSGSELSDLISKLSTQPTTGENIKPPTKNGGGEQEDNILKKLLLKTADVAPAVGGALGGFGGGVIGSPIPVVGNLAAGAAGAAVGAGAGYTIQQNIRRLLGERENVDAYGVESLKGMSEEATKAAISEAVGFGVGKIAGWGLKGGNLIIRGIGKQIDEIPLKQFNIKGIDEKNFYQKFKEPIEDFVVKHGYFGENGVTDLVDDIDKGQAVFDNLFKSQDVEVPVKEVVNQFKSKIDDLARVRGATTRVRDYARDLTKEIDNFVDVYGIENTVKASELSKLRGVVDDLVSKKEWLENPVLKKVYTDLRRIYNDSIKETVSKRLIGDGSEATIKSLDEVGAELNKRYDLLEMIDNRQFSSGSSPITKGALSTVLGIGGTAVGGLPGGVAGAGGVYLLDMLLKNPKVLKGLYQTGKLGTTVAEKATSPAVSSATAPVGGAGSVLLSKILGL